MSSVNAFVVIIKCRKDAAFSNLTASTALYHLGEFNLQGFELGEPFLNVSKLTACNSINVCTILIRACLKLDQIANVIHRKSKITSMTDK